MVPGVGDIDVGLSVDGDILRARGSENKERHAQFNYTQGTSTNTQEHRQDAPNDRTGTKHELEQRWRRLRRHHERCTRSFCKADQREMDKPEMDKLERKRDDQRNVLVKST